MAGIQSTPYTAGPFVSHGPQQLWQLQAALQQLLQLGSIQQQQLQQLLQLVPLQLHQIQQLIQFVSQQQQQPYQMPYGHPYGPAAGFGLPSIGGPGWLAGTQPIQPPVFAGQAGYVM